MCYGSVLNLPLPSNDSIYSFQHYGFKPDVTALFVDFLQ
jgi:hypothetical protein